MAAEKPQSAHRCWTCNNQMDEEPGCKALKSVGHTTWMMSGGSPQCDQWTPLKDAPPVQLVKAAIPMDLAAVLQAAEKDPAMAFRLGEALRWARGKWITPDLKRPLEFGEYVTTAGRCDVLTSVSSPEQPGGVVVHMEDFGSGLWSVWVAWMKEYDVKVWSEREPAQEPPEEEEK